MLSWNTQEDNNSEDKEIKENRTGILFVAMSDMNITSRIDAYLTNVKSLSMYIFPFLDIISLGKGLEE